MKNFTKNGAQPKRGKYKGIRCDSSWELAFLIYHFDHNLNIKRCEERRKYVFNGKELNYVPDFITDKGIIELKGCSSPGWRAKLEYNPDIIVYYKKEIQPYLDYVIGKYGEDFTKLYD